MGSWSLASFGSVRDSISALSHVVVHPTDMERGVCLSNEYNCVLSAAFLLHCGSRLASMYLRRRGYAPRRPVFFSSIRQGAFLNALSQQWFVSWGGSGAGIFRQRARKVIEQKPDPAARSQVLVHHEPIRAGTRPGPEGPGRGPRCGGQSRPGKHRSPPRAESGKLGQVAVAATSKDLRGQRATRNGEPGQSARIPVHPDELVLENLRRMRRQPTFTPHSCGGRKGRSARARSCGQRALPAWPPSVCAKTRRGRIAIG